MAFDHYSAEPPPEVKKFLAWHRLPRGSFQGWYDVPSLTPPDKRISQAQLQRNSVRMLDALGDLLYHPVLKGSLRICDTLVGCGHQCPVCLAKAALPSAMFSYEGIVEAFNNQDFLSLLQSNSFRIGSSGDILDHPNSIEIVRVILETTGFLDKKRLEETRNISNHYIVVFANYRPNLTGKIEELIKLTSEYPDRLRLVLSVPVTKNSVIYKQFRTYAATKPDIFNVGTDLTDTDIDALSVQAVEEAVVLPLGRMLAADQLPDVAVSDADKLHHYEDRGLVKVYLNPDGLWLMIYATLHESSTARVFTPLNSSNIDVLSRLPWHPDFPLPPAWPGKLGKSRSENSAEKLMERMLHKPFKCIEIVK